MLRKILYIAFAFLLFGAGVGAFIQKGSAQRLDDDVAIFRQARADTEGKTTQAQSPDAPLEFRLDDGGYEAVLGRGSANFDTAAPAIWLNHLTIPNNVPYPLTLSEIRILFPPLNDLIGNEIKILLYVDHDSDGNPANAQLVYQATGTIAIADGGTFQAFPISGVLYTREDIYVGWEDKWADGEQHPLQSVAALDETQWQGRSWIVANTQCCAPDINNLAANNYRKTIEQAGFGGNLMIRLEVDSYTPTSTPTPVLPRCPGETFTDVCPGDFFYEPVLALNEASIVSGYTSSPPCITAAQVPCFLPANNVTRGQTSKIISLAAGFNEPVSGQVFEDVPVGSTFYAYIQRLAGRGFIGGYACGGPGEPCGAGNKPYFRPTTNLTRGQLAKIAAQSFGYSDPTPIQTFEDVPPSSTFHNYIEQLVLREIINGYPCGGAGEPCGAGNRPYFRPGNQVTRAQTAKIVYLAMSQITPTPTNTSTSIPATSTPATSTPATSTPATSTPTDPTQTPTSIVTATSIPPTATATNTPTASPTCCADVTGTMTASCVSNSYTVNFSITNNCPVQKRADAAGMIEVSPNSNGPWTPIAVADYVDFPIPTGTTNYTLPVWGGPLPAGNNYWRYKMQFTGQDCLWYLTLTSNAQPACTVGTVTPVTSTPTCIPTSVPTGTPSASPTCCTDVTGSINASCLPNPYTVTYSTTNNCPIEKTANIASYFEVSPNFNGPWQTVYVGDCFDCPIPTGTTQHTMTVFSTLLPAGNYFWRYRMEFSGADCSWHLTLTSTAQPACIVP